MMASRYSNADSTEKTVKILLKHPNIDINLQTKNDSSALMLASRNTNTDSTEKTVKILLEHPDIDVKSKKTNFWSRYFGY
jgi:ankyrin repeat protein